MCFANIFDANRPLQCEKSHFFIIKGNRRKKNCINERFCERRISEVLDLKFSKLYQVVIWVPYYNQARERMQRASHFSDMTLAKLHFCPFLRCYIAPGVRFPKIFLSRGIFHFVSNDFQRVFSTSLRVF